MSDNIFDTLIPNSVYNDLPHISVVAEAPSVHASDLAALREILGKHGSPQGVTIRLVHKHFDTLPGEVMIFEQFDVPDFGTVKTMKPIVPATTLDVRGVNFFVTDEGNLQAYEYAPSDGAAPNMSLPQSFIKEFCQAVLQNNLQHVFGLRLASEDKLDKVNWTEYELGAHRSTIMLQDSMPTPPGKIDYTTNTEWQAKLPQERKCGHGVNALCKHCKSHWSLHDIEGGSIYLSGEKLIPDTPIFNLVRSVSALAFECR